MWLRMGHSRDRCLCLVLHTHSGACQKWMNELYCTVWKNVPYCPVLYGTVPYGMVWHAIVWYKAFSIMAPAVWNSLSSVMKSSAIITTFSFKEHLKQNCSLLHTTWSNSFSATGAFDSKSQHTAPPINALDIDIDIKYCTVLHGTEWHAMVLLTYDRGAM